MSNNETFVVYSANESATLDGAGFWSNEFGWVLLEDATQFSSEEKDGYLPISAGNDAKWVSFSEANQHYGTQAPEAAY